MLVHRPRLKTQGAVVTTVAMLAISGCDDPTARTDLRPEGPPDVLSVLVLSDSLNGLVETATFCAPGDEKRPAQVGLPDFTTTTVCPVDIAMPIDEAKNAAPEAWYVRVMFDELLDPDIEDLRTMTQNGVEITFGTLERTQPVTLECQDFTGNLVNVPYDGYYSPSGNSVTWPVGPSLVIKPNNPETISVASQCQVTLKENIVDKDGTTVESEQRGPYKFSVAPIQVISTAPADGATVTPEAGGVQVVFNTSILASSVELADFKFTPEVTFPTNTPTAFRTQLAANAFRINGNLLDGHLGEDGGPPEYTFEVLKGAKFTDGCGKESEITTDPSADDHTKVGFATPALTFITVAPFQGTGAVPGRKIRIDFNQKMSAASLTPDEFSLSPALPSGAPTIAADPADASVLVVNGVYALNTEYTFTINAGATIRDLHDTKDVVMNEAFTAKFTTADTIQLTATTPATGTTITNGVARVRLTFNQEMDPASFAAGTDYTFVNDATGANITVEAVPVGAQIVEIRTPDPDGVDGPRGSGELPNGNYTFTLKMGATALDKVTPAANTFTADGERVIKFTLQDPPAPGPGCLGAP